MTEELKISIQEKRFSDPDYVLENTKLLYREAKENGNPEDMIFALYYMGDAFLSKNLIKDAIRELFEALRINREYEIETFYEQILNVLAICFGLEGEQLLSLEYYYEGLSAAIRKKNYDMQFMLYNNIGIAFWNYQDMKNALAYFEKAKKARIALTGNEGKEELIDVHYHLQKGRIYYSLKKTEALKEELEIAKQLVKEYENDQYQLAILALELSVLDLSEKPEKIREKILEFRDYDQSKITMEDWEELKAIIEILKKHVEPKISMKIFQILYTLAYESRMDEKCSEILREWIEYLERLGRKEEKLEKLKLFYELEKRIQQSKKKIQIDEIKNRILLSQKLEEHDLMKKREESLNEISKKDVVTGFYNRRGMFECMEAALVRGKSKKAPIGLVLLEIQGFEDINLVFGHPIGDMCLQHVAEAVKKHVTKEEKVAHMRGSEIMILSERRKEEQLKDIVEKILYSLKKPLFLSDKTLVVKVNVGTVFLKPAKETTIFDLFHKCNQSLYEYHAG